MKVKEMQDLIEFYISSKVLSEWTKQNLVSNLLLKH